MKVAVVDDEKYWRDFFERNIIQYYSKDVIVDKIKSGVQYLNNREKYDISFIDIEMPGIDGFDTIKEARRENPDGIFIIMTTHTELSRKGYLVNAFRYIDKINAEEELTEALHSAEILLKRNEKIKLNFVGEGEHELVINDILYFETEKHNVLVHTCKGIRKCSNRMNEIEELLENKGFYRCHNAYIVNLDKIDQLNKTIISVENGETIEVSKRKISGFRKAYIKRIYECANA